MPVTEIRVYNKDLEFLGIIDNYTSLIWTRKFREAGNFQITCPITANNMSLIVPGNLVTKRNSVESGMIESITLNDSNDRATVKGRFLSSILDRRYLLGTVSYTNTNVVAAMQGLLSKVTALPIEIGSQQSSSAETVTFNVTNAELLSTLKNLSKGYNIGFRIRADYSKKVLFFETYDGINHTWKQSDNTRVIFSDDFSNLKSASYTFNNQTFKNVVIASASYSNESNTTQITVTVGDTEAVGFDRREVFYSTSVEGENLTQAQFTALLTQQAKEYLNTLDESESLDSKITENTTFEYKSDYDLGDIITLRKDEWNIEMDVRISEIQEVYEHEKVSITPTFGTPLPETISW